MTKALTDIEMSRRPYRTIWNLTWPQIVMLLIHSMIGLVDVWVAGRINSDVQAALGIITQALFFFLVVAMATANGAVAAISQSMGAGLYRRIQRYVGLCLELALAAGGAVLVLGLLFKRSLLELLQVPPQLMGITDYFLEVYLYVLPGYYLLIITNAVFRAQKRVMYPLYTMTIVTLLNTVLDLGLGLGWWGFPEVGHKGLAWATFGSVLGGALFNLGNLGRLGLLRRPSFAGWRWIKAALPYLMKVAWPAGLLGVVWHSAYMALYAVTASLPEGNVQALAGMASGIRIESLLFLPGFAFNFTASILIGHYLGAGQPEEAKRFGYRILGSGLVLVLLLAVGVWQVVEPLAAWFAPDPVVAAQAVDYLFWNILAMPFILTSFIIAGAFNGAGATLYNLTTMGISSWFVRLPLAWLLGHVILGTSTGVWMSMFVSQGALAVLMLYFYAFKNWQRFSMKKSRKQPQGDPECSRISSPLPSKDRTSIGM